MNKLKILASDNRIRAAVKIFVIFIIAVITCRNFFINSFDNFYLEKNYTYKNSFDSDSAKNADFSSTIEQQFVSKGNFLSGINIYIREISDQSLSLDIKIKDSENKAVCSSVVRASDLTQESWNTVSLDASGFKRGETCTVEIAAQGSGTGIISVIDNETGDLPYLGSCLVGGQETSGRLALGINQVYYYFDLAHGMYLGVNILFLIILLGILTASVLTLEKGAAALKEQGFSRYSLYSALIAVSFLLMFNPMDSVNTEMQEFSRVMGAGVVSGYDVSRVIGNFTGWILAIAFLYILIAAFMARIRTRSYSGEQKNAWGFLDRFMLVAFANLVFRCVTYFYDGGGEVFYYSSWLVNLILLAVFVYIFGRIDKAVSFLQYQNAIILVFAVSFPAAVLTDSPWQDGMLLLGVQYLLVILAALALKFVSPAVSFYKKNHTLVWAGIFVASLFPMALSVYIEAVNVLAGREIFVVRLRSHYAETVLFLFAAAIVLSAVLHRRKKRLPDVKKFAYPFLATGISLLSQQLPLSTTYTASLFEGANAGILISDFLNFGDIPVVQHYGGHMMTSVWEGILYGIINNDFTGAVFSPYNGLVVSLIVLAFYFFVKEITGEDLAFWIVLLFPFYGSVYYFALGLLIPAAIIRYIRKNTYLRAAAVWFSCLWVTLYRLDLGFSFDLACAVALLCYIIHGKNRKSVKQLGITLLGYGVVCGGLWCVLCILRDVNPVSRLLEFLKISASNQDWAYNSIGDAGNTMYAWCYVIVPLFVSVSLVYVILSKKFRGKAGTARWIFLIAAGTAYFANFSRGLVRHSLAENSLIVVLWTAHLYMALLISCYIKKAHFLLVFMGFILFETLLSQDTVFTETGIVDSAAARVTPFHDSWTLTRFDTEDYDAATMEAPRTYWSQLKEAGEKIDRVVINTELLKRVKPLEQLCEALLEKDETYVDFMNRTLTYCLLRRENPVYVSQSPLQLSGDYTQECFIEEISEDPDKNPIVIMPYSNDNNNDSSFLDGLSNTYRYYRVAEYIYQNYVPLCHNDEYTVWCLSARYDEMLEKLTDSEVFQGLECVEDLKNGEVKYDAGNLAVTSEEDYLVLTYTGADPMLSELQNYMDLTSFAGTKVKISVSYESDVTGVLQMFYTESEGEGYSEDKVVNYKMTEKEGTAEFVIPVTEYTRLRLDTPEKSTVKIISLTYKSMIELVGYGYDRYENETETAVYLDVSKSLHLYRIDRLPRIWGEMDEENAIENPVLSEPVKDGDYWKIENAGSVDKSKGNYLAFHLSYPGVDTEGYTKTDDETSEVTVRLGTMDGDKFVERCRYILTAEEGEHDYLIRVSSDYYWYLSGTDTIRIESDSLIKTKDVKILQGD